jgi:amino acid adenylation domain-containing protein
MRSLGQIIDEAIGHNPDKIAVEDRHHRISYRELDQQSSSISEFLHRHGVTSGDRIGIYSHKSTESVAAILGVLRANATYVPVGVDSPPARNAYIFKDCSVHSIIIEETLLPQFQSVCSPVNILERLTPNLYLMNGIKTEDSFTPKEPLAYILYTSGSTGNPKGVMYSHKGALSFIDWCSQTFPIERNDRFSSHAPFHFDLSIFDLYVCLKHGATLVLIDEDTGKNPLELGRFISDQGISVWYSTPSVLTLLTQFGKLEKYQNNPRLVLFAGEVFPIKHLRTLVSTWKEAVFFNLYGPTETNVCTYFEVPNSIPSDQSQPVPIGKSCEHLTCKAFLENGEVAEAGQRGELCVSGNIMSGYWNSTEKTTASFFQDPSNQRWYKTGDLVEQDAEGNFLYIGRKDRMVKRRGYRVELGEIETMLYQHPNVAAAGVVAVPDAEGGVQIKAFLQVIDREQATLIKMKQYASEVLPSYMIPDRFVFLSVLPKTSTDKIDYQALLTL